MIVLMVMIINEAKHNIKIAVRYLQRFVYNVRNIVEKERLRLIMVAYYLKDSLCKQSFFIVVRSSTVDAPCWLVSVSEVNHRRAEFITYIPLCVVVIGSK